MQLKTLASRTNRKVAFRNVSTKKERLPLFPLTSGTLLTIQKHTTAHTPTATPQISLQREDMMMPLVYYAAVAIVGADQGTGETDGAAGQTAEGK